MTACCALACFTLLRGSPALLLLAVLHLAALPGCADVAALHRRLSLAPSTTKLLRHRLHALGRLHTLLVSYCLRAMGIPSCGLIAAAEPLTLPRSQQQLASPARHPGARHRRSTARHKLLAFPGCHVSWVPAPAPIASWSAVGSTNWTVLGRASRPSMAQAPPAVVVLRSRRPGAVASCCYAAQASEEVVSIKIHSHAAYQQRDAIAAALHHHLQHALVASHPTLLATTLTPGCLQLFLSSFNLAAAAARPPHPTSAAPTLPTPLDTLIAGLHSTLPSFCHEQPISVQVGSRRALFQAPPNLPQFQDLRLGTQPPTPAPTHSAPADPAPTPAPTTVSPAGFPPGPPAGLLLPELSNQLLLEPPCVPAGAAGPVALLARLEGCGAMLEGEHEVEVVASWVQQGAVGTYKHRVPLELGGANASASLRLELPAGLGTGTVAFKVASLRPGYAGTLLAACTTMALPPPATQELCDLYAASQSCRDQAAGVRRLLLDMAAAWQLLDMDYDGPAGPTLLAGLLQYCSDTRLEACQQLLAGRCKAAGWLVVYAAPAPAVAAAPAAAAAAADNQASSQAAASEVHMPAAAACAEGEACLGQPPGCWATPHPPSSTAAASADAAARAAADQPAADGCCAPSGPSSSRSSLGSASHCSSTASSMHGKQQADAPQAAAAMHSDAAAATKDGSAATADALAMTYSEWKQQLAWRVDRAAPTAYAAVCGSVVALGVYKAPYGMQPRPWPLLAGLLLNWLALCAPHALLLWRAPRSRPLPRAAAAALQCAAQLGCGLAGCWLLAPAGTTGAAAVACFAVNGVFRPCLQLVSWRVQLLLQTLEAAAKAVLLLAAAGAAAHGMPGGSPPPPLLVLRHCLATVLAAMLTSVLVEHWARAAFVRTLGVRGRLLATSSREPAAGAPKQAAQVLEQPVPACASLHMAAATPSRM